MLPMTNPFASINISRAMFVFKLIIQNKFKLLSYEFRDADLHVNTYKMIFNWKPFVKRVCNEYKIVNVWQEQSTKGIQFNASL